MTINEKIKHFLEERPEIMLTVLAKNAGIPYMTLYNFCKRGQNMPEKHLPKLLARLRKFGWE